MRCVLLFDTDFASDCAVKHRWGKWGWLHPGQVRTDWITGGHPPVTGPPQLSTCAILCICQQSFYGLERSW